MADEEQMEAPKVVLGRTGKRLVSAGASSGIGFDNRNAPLRGFLMGPGGFEPPTNGL